MDAQLKSNLTSPKHWVRLVYMVLFAFFLYLAAMVMIALVVVQFIFSLLTGRDNHKLRSFGFTLTTYIQQALLFLSFNSELKPFPFADWPEAPVEHEPAPEAAAASVDAAPYGASAAVEPADNVAQHKFTSPQSRDGVETTAGHAAASSEPGMVKDNAASALGTEVSPKPSTAAVENARSVADSTSAERAQAVEGTVRDEGTSEIGAGPAPDGTLTSGRMSETADVGVAEGLPKSEDSSKAEGAPVAEDSSKAESASKKAEPTPGKESAHTKGSNKNTSTDDDENREPPLVDPEAEKKLLS